MASLVISTIAFFLASYFLKRYLDALDFPKGMVRSLGIFAIALAISYAVATAVDWIV